MKEIILVKYGEIILKGGNRPKFEKILLQNIADAIRNIATVKITIQQATIYIEVEETERIDLVCERLKSAGLSDAQIYHIMGDGLIVQIPQRIIEEMIRKD